MLKHLLLGLTPTAIAVLAVLGISDTFVTLHWSGLGLLHMEANPIMRGIIEWSPAFFVITKLAVTCLACSWLWKHRNNKLTSYLVPPVTALYGYAVYAGLVLAFG